MGDLFFFFFFGTFGNRANRAIFGTQSGMGGNTRPPYLISQMDQRSKGWCFTINNPTGWDDADIEGLKQATVYGVVGKETGEEGTPHLQGFCRFASATRFDRIKRLLPRAHLEVQRGATCQAAEYCKKDGDFQEWGDCPGERRNAKDRWRFIIDKAEIGDFNAIKDEYPGEYLRYFEKLRSLHRRPLFSIHNLENEWWWGSTGTGKSKKVWEEYPEHYGKMLNKWWDGYQDEDVVVIEEWAPKNECTASALKIWADRYPFNAEIKGGLLKKIRPKKIIVTSNYTIDQCFEKAEDRDPIKRRFKVTEFKKFDLDSLFNSQ